MIKNKFIISVSVIILLLFVVCGCFFLTKDDKKSYSAMMAPVLFSVQANTDGTLKEVYVKPNDKVKRGQLVAEIEIPSQEKISVNTIQKPDVNSAKAALAKAEAKYENAASMYKDGVISQEDYDDILAELKTAQNAYKNAVTQAQQYVSENKSKPVLKKVFAPADGTVGGKIFSKGSQIKSGDDIVHLNLESMKVTAYVDKNTLSKLERGQSVLIKVPEYKDRTFNGSIDRIGQNPFSLEEGKEPLYQVFINFDSNINSSVFTPSKDVSVYFLNSKRSVF